MILKQFDATETDLTPMYTNRAYGFYRWFVKELGEESEVWACQGTDTSLSSSGC